MSGQHVHSATGGRVRIWLAGLGVAFVAVLIAAFAAPANASSKTIEAQLSLSGLASADNPVGGSQLGVHPGDKVSFTAAGAPTAGLQKLNLDGLASSALSAGATFQVTADFSGLPGGKKDTVLSGSTKKTFSFPSKGSFSFTWTAQSVTVVPLTGTKLVTAITLDGNQLKQAGVKLNASNEYVGKIVAATNPPAGGLGLQVPGVKVAPSAPVVGQLPTLSIPGVVTPTLGVSVPDLNPHSASSGKGTAGSGKTAGSGASSSDPNFRPPAVSVPQMVLGGIAGGGGSAAGSGGDGGFRLGVGGTGANSQLATGSTGSGASGSSDGSASDAQNGSAAPGNTVDLASSAGSPSGQLPVVLAILAVITLAVVAGIYARLYLLGRKAASAG